MESASQQTNTQTTATLDLPADDADYPQDSDPDEETNRAVVQTPVECV